MEARTETPEEQNEHNSLMRIWASTWKKLLEKHSIKTSYMFLRSHVVAPYIWKWFQMLLRLFQIAVKLKFMEENQ